MPWWSRCYHRVRSFTDSLNPGECFCLYDPTAKVHDSSVFHRSLEEIQQNPIYKSTSEGCHCSGGSCSSNESNLSIPDLDLEELEIDDDEAQELRQRFSGVSRSLSIFAGHKNQQPLKTIQQRLQQKPAYESSEACVGSRLAINESLHANGTSGNLLDLGQSTFYDVTEAVESTTSSYPLFDCLFIAGLYHDRTENCLLPYTKDIFPSQYDLPQGIEEMCFPDAKEWSPHPQQRTSTYMVVLTDEEGYRTFCYCRRIQAEGDDVCMPLAMCILTRHSRARSLFSQILKELTKLYGTGDHDMTKIYSQIKQQPFPILGQSIQFTSTIRKVTAFRGAGSTSRVKFSRKRNTSLEFEELYKQLNSSPLPGYLLQRARAFSIGTVGWKPTALKGLDVAGGHKDGFICTQHIIRRPIDLRLGGADICRILPEVNDLLQVYFTVLNEGSLLVLGPSLSHLTPVFDAIESFLFPMSWQHTLIPALPFAKRTFIEAPTPYLVGLLIKDKCLHEVFKLEKRGDEALMTSRRSRFILPTSFRLFSPVDSSTDLADVDTYLLSFSSISSIHSSEEDPSRSLSSCSQQPPGEEKGHAKMQEDEKQFLKSLMDGSCQLSEDCLVIAIGSDGRGSLLKPSDKGLQPCITNSFAHSSGLPVPVEELLRERMMTVEEELEQEDLSSSEIEDMVKAKYIILCDTFIHLYYDLFGELEHCLMGNKDQWVAKDTGQSGGGPSPTDMSDGKGQHCSGGQIERIFELEEYMDRNIPETHKDFFLRIAMTSMFEEYIREKVHSMGMEIEVRLGQLRLYKMLDKPAPALGNLPNKKTVTGQSRDKGPVGKNAMHGTPEAKTNIVATSRLLQLCQLGNHPLSSASLPQSASGSPLKNFWDGKDPLPHSATRRHTLHAEQILSPPLYGQPSPLQFIETDLTHN